MEARRSRASIIETLKRFSGFSVNILLLALTFSYAMFQGGFVSWFLFFSFLPVAVYSLLLNAFPFIFDVKRNISSERLYAGNSVDITITATRKFPFPLLFLVVEDKASIKGHKHMLFPGFKRRLTIHYEISQVPRGEHIFQSVRFKTGDLFGFLEKETFVSAPQTILVYPKMDSFIHEPVRRVLERGTGAAKFQYHKDTSHIAGIREYQPGDRFSWIDWKATARTNDLMTKDFEVKSSNDPLFVLDRSFSVHFEKMVEFAASAAKSILESGGQAGLYFPGREKAYLPVNGGERHLLKILYMLAKVQPESENAMEDLFEETRLLQHGGSVIFISASLTKPFLEQAEVLAKRKRNVVVVLVQEKAESPKEKMLIQEALQRGVFIERLYDRHIQTGVSGAKEA
ncbi:DUF58 domain-containing protein [Siminovitchia sp. 179-K 8D1 HS]|uniref:DUF58 domain-containing protein n=1 Tax=Siminovitchia sp. 179-K 8D1 HS TaxID=3142385 RepID=UPI00399F05E8